MTPRRDELKREDKWNVEALYRNAGVWEEDFARVKGEGRWPEIEAYKGKLGTPKAAASFFDLYFGLDRELTKLHTYAHLRMDEDLGDDRSKRDFGLISGLAHDFQEQYSWVEPELLSLADAEFEKLQKSSDLKEYRFYLEKIGRMRPHTLSEEMEGLLALSGKSLETAHRTFSALSNADMQFAPALDSEGKEHPVTNGSYPLHMRSRDRVLRKNSFLSLHRGFSSYSNTIAELLRGQTEVHLYHARARLFPSCLDAALFPHNIAPDVYTNLIASVSQALPAMHDYIALRKELLGLEELHAWDLSAPLVDQVDLHMSYPEACQAVISSVARLGKEYQEEVRKGLLEERWVDVYETPRKRSGAYSSGCYDSMPYILLNYQGTLNDVLTLAHEVGHSMHSLLSRKNQSYLYSQYPIFVAEVASTFNEQLLLQMLKEKMTSAKERAYLIHYEIEGMRATLFRQTLFAEFELQIHKWAEDGVPVTPSLLSDFYLELSRKYYGPALTADPELAVEWARIPHFYYNFYVYQYATGLSAALSLFHQTESSGEAVERYLHFLSSGGSHYPLDLLQGAGVDMRKPQAIESAMQRFQLLVKELREILQGGN
ncbi:MAG: oligoendopeptidase F [Verrucomicrobiota bacterium]|nr:oligoendopeptidase F [Verrucomicrobiota bacterium]